MSDQGRNNIIPQLCDIRPVVTGGNVDWERIRVIGNAPESIGQPSPEGGVSPEAPATFSETRFADIEVQPDPIFDEMAESVAFEGDVAWEHRYGAVPDEAAPLGRFESVRGAFSSMFSSRLFRWLAFAGASCAVIGSGFFVAGEVMKIKGVVLGESSEGVVRTLSALENLKRSEWAHSAEDFNAAYASFEQASRSLGVVGNEFSKATRFFPWISKLASGQGVIDGAKHLSLAGAELSSVLDSVDGAFSDQRVLSGESGLFLTLLDRNEAPVGRALDEVRLAEDSFSRVNPSDIPEENLASFRTLQEKLPVIRSLLEGLHDHDILLRDLLGENGPRLYLFLFQNNTELRPTGGFIGSYGFLNVSHGEVRNFFVNGIFDPDGQLKVNVVPPKPIQKVSAAWSLHDSNWYPDFPTSAEKAIYFYEKTGGPTVDGVITLTPTVIVDLLKVTGPIEMPEYGVTIDADNFIPAIQEEVEVKYDKEENKPKKILSDLAPILLDRLLHSEGKAKIFQAVEALTEGLNERHILLYSRNEELERLVKSSGWGGEMLPTDKDYLSVVHSNLNGYKTDGIIDETIVHTADIGADGTVTDTVRITRRHNGGSSRYDWWNKVNSDYLRVYVPEGSELLSEKGATWEFPKEPLDYDALKFLRDEDVQQEEQGTVVDKSGTRISKESGKTVFGNWVYVSPGESVTVEYRYRLPFRVRLDEAGAAPYSLLVQKQSGSVGSAFRSNLFYPGKLFVPIWKTGVEGSAGALSSSGVLKTDIFLGVVFGATHDE